MRRSLLRGVHRACERETGSILRHIGSNVAGKPFPPSFVSVPDVEEIGIRPPEFSTEQPCTGAIGALSVIEFVPRPRQWASRSGSGQHRLKWRRFSLRPQQWGVYLHRLGRSILNQGGKP